MPSRMNFPGRVNARRMGAQARMKMKPSEKFGDPKEYSDYAERKTVEKAALIASIVTPDSARARSTKIVRTSRRRAL